MEFLGFGIYELFLLFFIYVLGCVVISDQLRLRWWEKSGCSAPVDKKKENGSTGWAFWIAIIYISLISFYIFYKLYEAFFGGSYTKFGKFKF